MGVKAPSGVTGPGSVSFPPAPDPRHAEVVEEMGRVAEHTAGERASLHELRSLLVQDRLELRIQRLPDTDVTLYRIIEPGTGRVVREFPPEGLARTLAEIRAKATEHLDARA
jgi:hypothetical protein